MASRLSNYVLENATNPGTGPFILNGAPDNRRSFASAFPNGGQVFYFADDGTQSEWGVASLTVGAPNTLSRTKIIGNTAETTGPLDFSATVQVYNEIPAEYLLVLNDDGSVSLGNSTLATAADIKALNDKLVWSSPTGGDIKVNEVVISKDTGTLAALLADGTWRYLVNSDPYTAGDVGIRQLVSSKDSKSLAALDRNGNWHHTVESNPAADSQDVGINEVLYSGTNGTMAFLDWDGTWRYVLGSTAAGNGDLNALQLIISGSTKAPAVLDLGGTWHYLLTQAMVTAQQGETGFLRLPIGNNQFILFQWGGFSGTATLTSDSGVYESDVIRVTWPQAFSQIWRAFPAVTSDVATRGQQEQATLTAQDTTGGSFFLACRTKNAAMTGGFFAIGLA